MVSRKYRYGLAGVVLASCLSLTVFGFYIGKQTSSPDAPDAVPRLLASVNLTLPIEKYLFSTAELKELQSAQGILITHCMKGFGFNYKASPPGPDLGPRSLMDRRYGLTDEKMAEAFGYHLGNLDPRKAKPVAPSLPAGDALVALTGKSGKAGKPGLLVNGKSVAPGGCSRIAEEAIFGKGEVATEDSPQNLNIEDFPQSINNESFFATKSSPNVVRAFKAWSSCMEKRGFSYADPFAAIDDKHFQGINPSSAEIKVATVDVACKKKTNLVGFWFSAETRFEKTTIRKNASRLNGELDKKKEALKVASDIIRRANG